MSVLSTLETFDSALDGFDSPSNPFLDEVRGEVGFVAELVVQGAFGFGSGGDVVSVVVTRNAARSWLAAGFLWNLATPVPAPLRSGVGAVFELLDSLTEGRSGSFGRVELDNGGSTVFHYVSHIVTELLEYSGVGLLS